MSAGIFFYLRGGPQEVRQRIMRRFQFFKGEWFLDQRLGVPHIQFVFGANPNITAIGALFRRVVVTTPGVIALINFRVDFNATRRLLSFEFRARTEGGDVAVTSSDPGFIYDVENMKWAE